MNIAELQPLARMDVVVGQPMPYATFDRHGRLLLAAGQIVADERVLAMLLEKGLFSNPRWATRSQVRPPASPPDSDKAEKEVEIQTAPPPRAAKAARQMASWRLLRMWAQGDSSQDAITVKLIGVHEGKSLVITAPERDGSYIFVRDGGLYMFRSFSGEAVYEFRSHVLKVRFEPYGYLHITWPQRWQMEKKPLRASRRVTTDLGCIVYAGTDTRGPFAKGLIVDLSANGARIVLKDPLKDSNGNVRVAFRLNVADQQILMELHGKAISIPAKDSNSEDSLGVEFLDLNNAEKLALHAAVHCALVKELDVPLYVEN